MSWYTIKAKLLSFFSDIRIYPGGIIIAGDSHYKIKGVDMREILDLIKPGDILLRRYSHYLGSVLIKGHFSHAALYVGENNVIHMLGEGITKEDILTFMRCDDVAVLRHSDEKVINSAIARAYKNLELGIEYDYDFDTTSPVKFYCTEFVDNCFDYSVATKLDIKDGEIIFPDDFLTAKIFEVIWKKG